MKFKQVNKQCTLPMLGYGTWKMESTSDNLELLHQVFDAGFRYVDTAMMYQNEEMIGDFITSSETDRNQLFVSTKISNDIGTYEAAIKALEASLEKLKTDYIDLVLIHWPSPIRFRDYWKTRNREVYRAMEDMQKDGRLKSIGVSNFLVHHLEALLETATITPALNQIECHPYNVDSETIAFAKKHNILTQCYSPLGQGSVLQDPIIKKLAEKHVKTPAQIILNWHLQCGRLVVTNSSNLEHIKQNFDIFDFSLLDEEMDAMNSLAKQDGRILPHPDQAKF